MQQRECIGGKYIQSLTRFLHADPICIWLDTDGGFDGDGGDKGECSPTLDGQC